MPAVVPLVVAGIGAASSAYAAHKASKQQQPLVDAQTNLANQQGEQGKSLFGLGFPALQKSSGYYGSLLSGNRAAVTQTLAPTVSQIGDVYKGAERNLTKLPAGATRDEATADLSRQRAGQIGGLPMAARSGAAEALTNMGTATTGTGVNATGSAGGLFGTLVNQQQRQSAYDDQQHEQLGANLSSIIGDFIKAYRDRQSGGSGSYYPVGSTGGSMGSAGGY